jgi:UDP-sulfoquinovose synthase
MAFQNPPEKKQLRIFNQIMETFSVTELAEKTARVGRSLGYDVRIDHVENPRTEAEKHYYNPVYQGLIDIGVTPHYLTDEVMEEIFRLVTAHRDSIRHDVIFRGIKWG